MRKAVRAVQKAISTVETAKMTADEVVSVEMRDCLMKLATPSEPGKKLKRIWDDLSRATGLTYGQVKRLWKREWKVIPASVADEIRRKVADHERKLDARDEAIAKRFWHLNHTSSDPEFYQGRTATSDPSPDDLG
jgi:hypothetical protein